MKLRLVIGAAAVALATASVLAGPALAKGCGGYVNVAVWGCAPWDNNPPKAGVTPGYKPAPTPVSRTVPGTRLAPALPTSPTVGGKVISDNGLGLRSNPASGIISDNSGGLRKR